jgi:two-component system chemotaxis response regulator CheV
MEQTSVLLASDTNELEIVEFHIDETDHSGGVKKSFFGVNVAKVREIIRIPTIWKVFNSHPAVAGMIRLRDRVITVIDLATVLNRRSDTLSPDKIIVLEFNRLTIGILVHGVTRIHRISWQQVEPPSASIAGTNVTGLVKMEDRIVLLVDFEKIVGEICAEYSLQGVDQTMEASPAAAQGCRAVLVADDSPFIRQTLASALRSAGFTVEEFENGELAWQAISTRLDRLGDRFRQETGLLITDVEMPKMDGLHLTSLIRKEPRLNGFPVIIFSSMASDDNRRKWSELGAQAIITKPDLPNLVDIVNSLIG